jgi:DNA polymerase III delta prime subunit
MLRIDMQHTIWEEKYRPTTIKDCVLPASLKTRFQCLADKKIIPNLLLSGGPGCGKTTIAKAMLDEIGAEWIYKNSQVDINVDALRVEIMEFANTRALNGERKFVILDEADYLNQQYAQPALRAFMMEYSANCGFILTANYPHKIMKELRSRLDEVRFDIGRDQFNQLGLEFLPRLFKILETEGVTFDPACVAGVFRRDFPDFRKVLNDLQGYAAQNRDVIDSGILMNRNVSQLIEALKTRDFSVYEEVLAKSPLEPEELFRGLYDARAMICHPASYPALIERIATYQYQNAFVADKHINNLALLASIVEGVPMHG